MGNLLIPLFDGDLFSVSTNTTPMLPVDITGKTVKILISSGTISSTTSKSLHLSETDVDYTTPSANTDVYIILIFSSASGTHDVEIIEDSTVDNGGGTQRLDLSNIPNVVAGGHYTCRKVTIVTSGRYITIKNNSSVSTVQAVAYVLE